MSFTIPVTSNKSVLFMSVTVRIENNLNNHFSRKSMVITGTQIVDFFSSAVYPRLHDMVYTPFTEPNILWTILPLLVTAFFVEMYFGRYRTEELGWNTAFANCISLLWVTTALIRFMYESHGKLIFETVWTQNTPILILIAGLGLWSLMLGICNYFHFLPKSISFLISSTIPVNVTAVLAVVIVIGKFAVDNVTLTAAIIIFICLALIFVSIQALVTPSAEAQLYMEEYSREAEQKKKEHKLKVLHFFHMIKTRIIAHYLSTKSKIYALFGKKKKT